MADPGACTSVEECNASPQYLSTCCPQVLQGTAVNCEVDPGKDCPNLSYQLPAQVGAAGCAAGMNWWRCSMRWGCTHVALRAAQAALPSLPWQLSLPGPGSSAAAPAGTEPSIAAEPISVPPHAGSTAATWGR